MVREGKAYRHEKDPRLRVDALSDLCQGQNSANYTELGRAPCISLTTFERSRRSPLSHFEVVSLTPNFSLGSLVIICLVRPQPSLNVALRVADFTHRG
jgi:hypothetical protein